MHSQRNKPVLISLPKQRTMIRNNPYGSLQPTQVSAHCEVRGRTALHPYPAAQIGVAPGGFQGPIRDQGMA